MRFRSSEAASATGARLHGPDVWIEGASFDSRSLRPGSLFVPIVAARDGHDHIADVFSAGAAASLSLADDATTLHRRFAAKGLTVVIDDNGTTRPATDAELGIASPQSRQCTIETR